MKSKITSRQMQFASKPLTIESLAEGKCRCPGAACGKILRQRGLYAHVKGPACPSTFTKEQLDAIRRLSSVAKSRRERLFRDQQRNICKTICASNANVAVEKDASGSRGQDGANRCLQSTITAKNGLSTTPENNQGLSRRPRKIFPIRIDGLGGRYLPVTCTQIVSDRGIEEKAPRQCETPTVQEPYNELLAMKNYTSMLARSSLSSISVRSVPRDVFSEQRVPQESSVAMHEVSFVEQVEQCEGDEYVTQSHEDAERADIAKLQCRK